MKKTHVIGIAVLLAAGRSLPALADWNPVGDLQVSPDHFSNAQLSGFTGPVEQIRLRSAGRSDCDNVRVTYENGDTQSVFAGTILSGQDQLITFPDQTRMVKAVSLNCRAANGIGTHIAVSVDTPAFSARDSYGPAFAPAGDFELLASRDFGDLNRRTLMLDQTRPVAAIALEPVGADARCHNVSALFDDGTTSSAIPNDGDNLREGRMYRTYIGGGNRDLDSVNLTCEAANGDHVRINVYAIG
ncbi:MAG TPA: hypothetical protein VG501_04095 [Rhizomicrobium sp.]|nr:hypothetical protein [Rhizomicrobium sp.]